MSAVLLVLTDSVEGRDDEFNDWYDRVHLPEILAHPSFRSAQRYRANPALPNGTGRRYLTVYQVEDAVTAAQELGGSSLTPSDALLAETVLQGFYDGLERP